MALARIVLYLPRFIGMAKPVAVISVGFVKSLMQMELVKIANFSQKLTKVVSNAFLTSVSLHNDLHLTAPV